MAKVGVDAGGMGGRCYGTGAQTEGGKDGFGDRSAVRGGTGAMGKAGTLGEECESKGGDEDSGQCEELELSRDHEDSDWGTRSGPVACPHACTCMCV